MMHLPASALRCGEDDNKSSSTNGWTERKCRHFQCINDVFGPIDLRRETDYRPSPLVHASHELSEVAVIADPNGSLAEREAIVKQTNTDARARDCRTFSTYTTETCKML